jgi:ketosteroid isomerase-like protein
LSAASSRLCWDHLIVARGNSCACAAGAAIWEAHAMSAQTVESLYAAFDRRDGEARAALYAPDGRFRDPVFGELTGTEAGAMWRMLTGRAEDLRVELVEHDGRSAHWIATYTFTQTGRPVVNDVRARFAFRDGLIVEHIDTFSFWKWSRQALGPAGLVLGWTPILRGKVGAQARAGLRQYMARA